MRRTLALAAAAAVLLALAAPGRAETVRRCNGVPATIVGKHGRDNIVGTKGADVIWAGRGFDLIRALGGDDLICGGPGRSNIYAGDGDDRVWAGRGGDYVELQAGDDVAWSYAGNDDLTGGPGADALYANLGDDDLFHQDGEHADVGEAGRGFDRCFGDSDDDFNRCEEGEGDFRRPLAAESAADYAVSHEDLKSHTIAAHVAKKAWSDADSFDDAHMAALALFPSTSDEPPFLRSDA